MSDQTENNPAALEAQVAALDALGTGYQSANNIATPPALDANGNLFIPNVTPDAGLSAPFNTWFTLFGQFFDHGLDLVNKGGNGTVRMLLAYDDPLYNKGVDNIAGTEDDLGADMVQGTFDDPFANFMSLTRATQTANGMRRPTPLRPSSTRTRPTPRIPRIRCSCASTLPASMA